MEELSEFSKRLKAKRMELGWTQSEFASKAGITPAAASQMEAGERNPSLAVLQKIAKTLSVSIDFLVGKSDIPNMQKAEGEWQEFHRNFIDLNESDKQFLIQQVEFMRSRKQK